MKASWTSNSRPNTIRHLKNSLRQYWSGSLREVAGMFARVIVDIANSNVNKPFTYSIPSEIELQMGHRVLVPFGRSGKPVEGFVVDITEDSVSGFEIKSIIRRLEPYTTLLDDQLELARWMCRVYHCCWIDALRLMIPAKLRGSRIKEKKVRTLRLADGIDIEAVKASMLKADLTPKAPKQYEILCLFKEHNIEFPLCDINAFVPNAASAVSSLVKKGILVEQGRVTFRSPFSGLELKRESVPPPKLTPMQEAALEQINCASCGECILLHGVTGSGKTEVYMRAINGILEQGKGAIVLVPEIALTPQTTDRFRQRFGDGIAVFHSRLSDGERYDEWRRIRFGKARVVIGARSAVFAPVENLSLIIIDEEHENSYQSETTPKYSAIEVALQRAKLTGSKLVLGSATPSLTSYYRAKTGRFKLVELPERINGIAMPQVSVVDMREEFAAGNNGIFSSRLIDALRSCIAAGEQAILFLNRRGYSSHAECRACGFVFTCPQCDVALTYHKFDNSLKCHYCGAHFSIPKTCPQCGSIYLKYTGIGTQQVDEQLKLMIEGVRSLRMDTDTTSGKNSHHDILEAFSSGKADVLIGTQMIAKGLDIPNVTLVGVIHADSTLFYSDYRSSERTFQLLTQVAGRAGRAQKSGRVIIQTNAPSHRAIRLCVKHDYKTFYKYEISERLRTLFPPFSVIIKVLFTSVDESIAERDAEQFSHEMSERITALLDRIDAAKELLLIASGAAPMRRRNGEYRFAVIIKLLRSSHTAAAVDLIYAFADSCTLSSLKSVEINPQDML